MEGWEYAAGYQAIDDSWVPSSEVGTYERAQLALNFMVTRHEDEDWMIMPSILKRSDRHPTWHPVHDHAAELLAEVMLDTSKDFAVYGAGVMQGSDLAKVFKKIAHLISNKLPQENEEYGS